MEFNELQTALKQDPFTPLGDFKALLSDAFFMTQIVFINSLSNML